MSCSQTRLAGSGDIASRVYVPPGEHDEFYAFMSGGFSGQLTVHGLPSGRLLKNVAVFFLGRLSPGSRVEANETDGSDAAGTGVELREPSRSRRLSLAQVLFWICPLFWNR